MAAMSTLAPHVEHLMAGRTPGSSGGMVMTESRQRAIDREERRIGSGYSQVHSPLRRRVDRGCSGVAEHAGGRRPGSEVSGSEVPRAASASGSAVCVFSPAFLPLDLSSLWSRIGHSAADLLLLHITNPPIHHHRQLKARAVAGAQPWREASRALAATVTFDVSVEVLSESVAVRCCQLCTRLGVKRGDSASPDRPVLHK